MGTDIITNPSELSQTHFTLEELEEMNREMESIMLLTDELILPRKRRHGSGSNIIKIRPDIILPQING